MRETDIYNLILLGGTGARCGEIFIHMCANGYFSGQKINILYIDSDTENGNAKSLKMTYETYKKCREQYVIAGSQIPGFFRPQIELEGPVKPTGNLEYFRDMANSENDEPDINDGAKALMHCLYSDEECDLKITDGFFARPNVGSAVFAANTETMMSEFLERIRQEKVGIKKVHIYMIGSVFGGTGASSLPTISRYLKKKLSEESTDKKVEQKLRIGAGVVLPYFSFKRDREKERTKEEQEVEIEAEKFSVKTKMALQYYEDLERKYNLKIFDSVYILGHDGYDVRGIYDTAGSGQHNLPHITEFYTAMAAVTFFRDKGDGKYFAVVPKDKINWRSMDESSNCFLSFFIMMRFAITMKSLILEELFDVAHDGQVRRKTINKIPWYFDFIDGKSRSLDLQLDSLKEKFSAIDEYCNRYIRWFAELMIDNIDKVKRPDTLNFLEKKGKKKDLSVEPDLVQYLDLFTGELLERQYANILMENGTLTYDTDKIKAKVREDNIRYIRRHSKEICQDVIMDELNMKKISFEDIWTRITMFGFSHTMKIDGILKNIRDTESPTMEEGVKNLVNAVYISCMA